jgi:hypothetical protein
VAGTANNMTAKTEISFFIGRLLLGLILDQIGLAILRFNKKSSLSFVRFNS